MKYTATDKTAKEKTKSKNIKTRVIPGYHLSLPSALSTGIISLDTYGNVTNIVASTTPGIAKVILTFVPNISLNHLITG